MGYYVTSAQLSAMADDLTALAAFVRGRATFSSDQMQVVDRCLLTADTSWWGPRAVGTSTVAWGFADKLRPAGGHCSRSPIGSSRSPGPPARALASCARTRSRWPQHLATKAGSGSANLHRVAIPELHLHDAPSPGCRCLGHGRRPYRWSQSHDRLVGAAEPAIQDAGGRRYGRDYWMAWAVVRCARLRWSKRAVRPSAT